MSKRKIYKIYPIRKYIIILLFIFLFIGIGYSVFSVSLGVFGNVNVEQYDDTLYGIFTKEYRKNTGLVSELTGEHQDSFDSSLSTEKIYYWYGSNSTNGTLIYNKYNVIFAGQCWQMFRTTDTGGVKLIYNGVAENNQCLESRGNRVGYNGKTTKTLSTTYSYATDYTYDADSGLFSLSGTITTGSIPLEKYTCASTSTSCSELYLVYNLSSGSSYNVLVLQIRPHNSLIGSLPYNLSYDLSGFGYMFGENIVQKSSNLVQKRSTDFYNISLYSSYWYADDVVWNSSTSKWELVDPYKVSDSSELLNLEGKYTFLNKNETYTNSSVYYIAEVESSSSAYCLGLSSGNNITNAISYYGSSYVDNGDGTYSVVNGTSFEYKDFLNHYDNIKDHYLCFNSSNNRCSEIWYVMSYNSLLNYYYYVTQDNCYKYANGYTYANGQYTLNNDYVDSCAPTRNAHYSCFNTTGVCTNIYYIMSAQDNYYYKTLYYEFSNGNGIDYLLSEAFNHNFNNSVAKTAIDAWFKKYLNTNEYLNYIDDIIYCNYRDYNSNDSESFINPNGGNLNGRLNFNTRSTPLSCPRVYDQFSVSNPSAPLSNPIGMATSGELSLMSDYNTRKSSNGSWLLTSAYFFQDYGSVFSAMNTLSSSGKFNTSREEISNRVDNSNGIRPVIALKSGTKYVSGDGSLENPYIVDTN